jgi:hypothetical protein
LISTVRAVVAGTGAAPRYGEWAGGRAQDLSRVAMNSAAAKD